MIFGQDDEEFWASIPVIGQVRSGLIGVSEAAEAIAGTNWPWLAAVGVAFLAGLIVDRLVLR